MPDADSSGRLLPCAVADAGLLRFAAVFFTAEIAEHAETKAEERREVERERDRIQSIESGPILCPSRIPLRSLRSLR